MRNDPKKLIIAGAAAIILLIGLIWMGTHSVISVNIAGEKYNAETYAQIELIDKTGASKTYQATDANFKRLVGKGTYTVVVKGGGNYFRTVKTKPFLGVSKVDANLQAEAQRTFIGSNPAPCMFYLGDRLLSQDCDQAASSLKEHMPASASLPTYAQYVPTAEIYGENRGIVTTRSGQTVMLQYDEEGSIGYRVQAIQPNLTGGQRYRVPTADKLTTYKIAAFRDGFVVYDTAFGEFLYYGDVSSQPQKLNVEGPENTAYSPQIATFTQDTITLAYSDIQGEDESHDYEGSSTPPATIKGTGSEIIVYQAGGEQKHYEFVDLHTKAVICGSGKLCAGSSSGLNIYDISGGKAKHLYNIGGVTDMQQLNGTLLAISDEIIYNVNADEGSGFADYTFGDKYQYCGFTPAPQGYVLCVFDDKGVKSALYINQSEKNTDSIDKRVLAISGTKDVDDVSIYGRYIYVVPNYGDPIYDPTNKIYIPDPAKVRIVNNAISESVKKSGIDTTKYSIINTGTQ